ncbi:MAG: hypothetical protein WCI77_03780 [Candidatus Omnitrophota bacterium]
MWLTDAKGGSIIIVYMKRKYILLAAVLLVSIMAIHSGVVWAIAEKKVGTVTIKASTGTRDIMPFLEDMVVRWGKYFRLLYGEYKNDKIVIQIDTNGNYFVFDEISRVGHAVAYEVATLYPLAEATIVMRAPESEGAWHTLEWTVIEGEITNYTER